MNEHDEALDPIERLLREARHEAPAGLAARLARAALERDAGARIFWLDLERLGWRATRVAVAAALVAAVGAAFVTATSRGSDPASAARWAAAEARSATLDDEVAELALAPHAFERRLEREMK
jgi:hypothetical protein